MLRAPYLLAIVTVGCSGTTATSTQLADNLSADGLTVIAYNAEFLWDGIEPKDSSSRVEFPWRGNPEAAKQHMQNVADLIRQADADIVLLQEVRECGGTGTA